jgi:hypothetical protein
MKTITLTPKEYMLLRTLAFQYNYSFEVSYKNNAATVTISQEFCDAFGF